MKRIGKKRETVLSSIEAYASCSPSTGCDSDFLCKCNCSHGGTSASMAPPQSSNCKMENSAYWSNYIKNNGNYSPYNYGCKR